MSQLYPCTTCQRHVRITESACPFCDARLVAPETAPRDPSTRLGRAAIFAFGATTAVAITVGGCSGGGATAAIYGGPPPSSVTPPSSGSGPQIPPSGTPPPDTSTIYAPYGAPPLPPPTPVPPPTDVPPEVES